MKKLILILSAVIVLVGCSGGHDYTINNQSPHPQTIVVPKNESDRDIAIVGIMSDRIADGCVIYGVSYSDAASATKQQEEEFIDNCMNALHGTPRFGSPRPGLPEIFLGCDLKLGYKLIKAESSNRAYYDRKFTLKLQFDNESINSKLLKKIHGFTPNYCDSGGEMISNNANNVGGKNREYKVKFENKNDFDNNNFTKIP